MKQLATMTLDLEDIHNQHDYELQLAIEEATEIQAMRKRLSIR